MGKSQQTFSKKEREKKRRKKKQEKLERRQQRKLEKESAGKKTFEDQLSYVDENGNLTSTPPDQKKKRPVLLEEIVLGVPPNSHQAPKGIRKGVVKYFDHNKGYGFISDKENNDSIFLHIKEVDFDVKENDSIIFEVKKGPKGLMAYNVKRA